ncbi:MAG: hypothetical protein WCJ93_02875 [Methanomicrobiales archaeon]
MQTSAGIEEQTIESELARTVKYIDLYMQQKMDLFLQHYVFEPVNFLIRQIMYLSIVVTLLVAGIVVLLIGVILYLATFVPLWTALFITGAILLGMGVISSYILISMKIVLKTPIATEAVLHE